MAKFEKNWIKFNIKIQVEWEEKFPPENCVIATFVLLPGT